MLDPLLLLINLYTHDKINEKHPIFIINFILSLILVLSACFYNELFVLFCWKLEENTYLKVSERASELNEILNDDDNSSDDENDETNK